MFTEISAWHDAFCDHCRIMKGQSPVTVRGYREALKRNVSVHGIPQYSGFEPSVRGEVDYRRNGAARLERGDQPRSNPLHEHLRKVAREPGQADSVVDVNYFCAVTTIGNVHSARRRGRRAVGNRLRFSKGCGMVPSSAAFHTPSDLHTYRVPAERLKTSAGAGNR